MAVLLLAVARPHESGPRTPSDWGRLLVRATSEGGSFRRIALAEPADKFAITPDGLKIYASKATSRTMSIIRTADGTVKRLTLPWYGGSLAMSPDGRILYVGSATNGVALVDTATDQVLPGLIETVGQVFDLAITPDGKKLYMALGAHGVKGLQTNTKQISKVTDRICPENIALDPPGTILYVSYQCGGPGGREGHDSLEAFSTNNDKSLGFVTGYPMVGGDPLVSPDGRLLLLDGRDACMTPHYDHQGCPSAQQTYVIHFMWADRLHIFQTLGLRPWTAVPSTFLDTKQLLFLGNSISVMNTSTYAFLEKWTSLPELYSGAALSPDRRQAYVGVDRKNELLATQAEDPACNPPAEGLALYYSGDGVTTDRINGGNITSEGDTHFAPGRVGQAFFLDGKSSFLNVTSKTGHYRFGRRESSAALYVKFTKASGAQTVLDRTSSDVLFGSRLKKNENQHFEFELAPGTSDHLRLEGVTRVLEDTWYHVVIAINEKALAMYVNARIEAQAHITASRSVSLVGDEMSIYFGATSNRQEMLHGKLDEVLFYSRELSEDAVSRLYKSREHGACKI